MKKNKTKSILACAVLASVLASGMVPVQAANVNALVAPKDFGTLIGKSISFGQQLGYVENKTVTYPTGTPTWQFITEDNGRLTLLANQVWGKNRFSDTNIYNDENPGAVIQQYFYREALQYLDANRANFFSTDELNLLQNQTSAEVWMGGDYTRRGETKYSGIFALPTEGQVNALGANSRKRSSAYCLNDHDYRAIEGAVEIYRRPHTKLLSFLVHVVQTNGSIVQQPGEDAKNIYPTITFDKPLSFIYYLDKNSGNTTFSGQNVSEPTITLKNFTLKDTVKEKNVNITKFSIAQDGITISVDGGLATGEGQGLGGLLEDANGNYLAYARLADNINADGTVKDVEIKFADATITGNNTIHLFNEWLGSEYDLAGNYTDVGVALNNNKISELTYLPKVQELTIKDDFTLQLTEDRVFKKLTIGSGEFSYKAVNIPGKASGSYWYTECQTVKVTEALNWTNVLQAEGEIIFKGSFSLEGTGDEKTLTLVRPTNTNPNWNQGITGWNDITYNGQAGQSATLKVKGKMHGLIVNGGTFTAEKDLILDEYLRVNNGAVVNLGGDVTTNNVNLNGTLSMTTANKTLTVNNLTTTGDATITGVNSSDKVAIDENLTAKGNITLDKITLEVGENIQVQGNLNGNADISADKIVAKGSISANSLTVKNYLNVINGDAQNCNIGTLIFGESGKTAIYAFDVGKDKLTITGSASGSVKLVSKYGTNLSSGGTVDVFSGGNLDSLVLEDTRVTDMANNKTYILTQDTYDKGKLKVTASKHNNAVMNFADAVKGQKIVFGNYWQDNGIAKQPVAWSYVKQDNGQYVVFLSEKILGETGGRVGDGEMWKITNFLKQDGVFVKDLFTINELALLNVTNGDVLGLPSYDDVKDGGNYGWNAESRKASTTSYAGAGGRYYALSTTHNNGVNDWVDSSNGDIGTYGGLWFAFGDGSHYGIRPTISFDTSSVLFATNADEGKGSVADGKLTRLKDVGSNSTLELTFDDAYVAQTKGTARMTGDVALGNNIILDGGSVSVDYSDAKFADGNSFVSLFIGEGDMPQDYFGYGKTKASTDGSGTLTVDLGSFANGTDTNGYALTFFNEYGNGTSLAGKFNVLPGVLKVEGADKHLTYTIAAGDVAQDIQVGKNNVVVLTGTGELTQNITGEGRGSVNGNITANGDKMQVDFETVGSVMNISGGNVKGSLKGNFKLTGDTTFSGNSLQGEISGDQKLTLNNNVQIKGNEMKIANLNGTVANATTPTTYTTYTLDMQQTDGTVRYDYLTIGKLWGNANLAIDVGKYSGSDVFTSDKIDLKDVESGKTITLTAINLIDDPGLSSTNQTKIVYSVVSGSARVNVAVDTGLELYGANSIYKAELITGSEYGKQDLKLTYDRENNAGLKGFLENANGSSYSFRSTLYLGDVGDPTDAVRTAGADNYTKTVFMNGNELRGYGENSKNGIVIDGTNHHTLTLINGKITSFDTALTVEEGATLILENVRFPLTANNLPANHTDVENNGTMNIRNTATIYKLAGSGTTNIIDSSYLVLYREDSEGELNQKFAGSGQLQLRGNVTIAADKLAVEETYIGNDGEWKTLTLTGGADAANRKTLQSTVKGSGTIEIGSGNFVEADASKLGVAVENKGDLKLNSTKEMILQKDITGTGNLEFAQNTRINSKVTQGAITVAENVAIDVYQDLTANSGSITNNGSILIDIDNLKNNVNNVGNGTVYLRNLGTEASKNLTKTITDGKVIVMNDVISSLQKLQNTEVCLAGGTNLTLRDIGLTAEIEINIKGYGSGAGTLITNCDGSTGTYFYRATMDNIQVPLVNRGTLELNKGSTVYSMTGKMDSITNSGTLSIGAGITLERTITNSDTLNINGCLFSGEMTNSGKVTFKPASGGTTSVCTITGTINNSGTVEIKEGNTFETATAKVTGGKLILDGNYTFSNANIQGLTELYVDGATYNFNAELGATPSVELIDAEKVTGTLNLGTVTATSNETLYEWELGETKIAPYLKDNIGNTVAVGNTAVVFSGDNYRFTFSQAKEADGTTNKIGYLGIIKENGGELWQIVRNTQVSGYHCGNVATYSLTGDYTEQMKDATTDTNKLGTLTPVSPATSRTLTIEGNGHFFAGGAGTGSDKKGIEVNAGDILNLSNISDIKNWNGYVVSNSGTLNFNGTNVLNSKIQGNGTFNNNGELTVTDTDYLGIDELINNGIIKINRGLLCTKIIGGILKIAGSTSVAIGGVAEGAAKLDVREIDIEPDSELMINDHTSTLGEMWIDNAGTLTLDIDRNKAFICGGKVVIVKNRDYGPFITTQSILADEIILGDSGDIDPDTLNVTGDTDDTVLAFGKISGINDDVKLNITKGKVYALDEVNGKIILGENVSLDIDADNIKKNVEIGTNANLNLGDGTFASSKISGTNSGTVNFVGNVKVDGSLSLPKVTFANGSTTTLTVTAGGDAPLQVTDTISIDSGAKLFVDGAEKGETYEIVSGDAIEDDFTGWTLDNIRGEDATGRNVKAKSFAVDSNVYSIVFKSALPENTDLGKILENADGTPLMDWAEKVCDYFDTAYGDAGEAYTANAINSMASASVLAGAQKGAATMVNQVAGNISANVGVGARAILSGVRGQVSGVRNVSADVKLASPLEGKRADKGAWSGEGVDETAINTVEVGKASEVMPTEYKDKVYDKQVWASYIHSKQKIDGLKTGSLTQNSTIQLNGVTVGADLWSGKKSFGGLAITYADGNANSAQMSNSTKNEAKYYGISMYHRQDMGKYALTTDIGYTYNKNDITQHTTGITDEVTSKPKSDAYTVGMKLEREIYLSKACKIVPFAGARYTRLQNRDFSNSLGANTKVDNQNLVTVPVGLSFHSHLITTEGWKLGSILEGGYEWNFGNRHSTQEFGYGGAYNSIGFDVVDRGQYFVKAALTADYKNMFFELGYRYSKGKSVRDNKWNFNANFIF